MANHFALKTYNVVLREGQWINNLLSELVGKYENISFVDPMDRLCDGDECFIVRDKKLLYSDHAHLTTFGARDVLEGVV